MLQANGAGIRNPSQLRTLRSSAWSSWATVGCQRGQSMIVPRFCLPTAMLYLAELLFQLGKLAAQTMPLPEIQRRIDNVYARGRSSVGFSLRGDDGSACRC